MILILQEKNYYYRNILFILKFLIQFHNYGFETENLFIEYYIGDEDKYKVRRYCFNKLRNIHNCCLIYTYHCWQVVVVVVSRWGTSGTHPVSLRRLAVVPAARIGSVVCTTVVARFSVS